MAFSMVPAMPVSLPHSSNMPRMSHDVVVLPIDPARPSLSLKLFQTIAPVTASRTYRRRAERQAQSPRPVSLSPMLHDRVLLNQGYMLMCSHNAG